jgi:hypothetical protein
MVGRESGSHRWSWEDGASGLEDSNEGRTGKPKVKNLGTRVIRIIKIAFIHYLLNLKQWTGCALIMRFTVSRHQLNPNSSSLKLIEELRQTPTCRKLAPVLLHGFARKST